LPPSEFHTPPNHPAQGDEGYEDGPAAAARDREEKQNDDDDQVCHCLVKNNKTFPRGVLPLLERQSARRLQQNKAER